MPQEPGAHGGPVIAEPGPRSSKLHYLSSSAPGGVSFWGLVPFLSRLPGREETPERLADGLSWFPWVGLLTGAVLGVLAVVESSLLPTWVSVLAFFPTFYAVKGILHTDGLADYADGLAAHGSPQARQRIMYDPHVGVAGAVTVALFLGAVGACLWELPAAAPPLPLLSDLRMLALPWAFLGSSAGRRLLAFIVAEVAANVAMVVAVAVGKPSSGSRLARAFVERRRPRSVAVALLSGLLLLTVLGGELVVAIAGAALVGGLLTTWANRSLGGLGGDTLGAVHETTFVIGLVLAATLSWSPLL